MLSGENPPVGRIERIKEGLKQLGAVERVVPIVFGALYIALLIGRLVP